MSWATKIPKSRTAVNCKNCWHKAAFHDTDTDILVRILADMSDGKILTRMLVSVSI